MSHPRTRSSHRERPLLARTRTLLSDSRAQTRPLPSDSCPQEAASLGARSRARASVASGPTAPCCTWKLCDPTVCFDVGRTWNVQSTQLCYFCLCDSFMWFCVHFYLFNSSEIVSWFWYSKLPFLHSQLSGEHVTGTQMWWVAYDLVDISLDSGFLISFQVWISIQWGFLF